MGAGTKGAGGQQELINRFRDQGIEPKPAPNARSVRGSNLGPNDAPINQLPRTTFQAQYGMPGVKGNSGYSAGFQQYSPYRPPAYQPPVYQPPVYQPQPYMGGKGMGYGYQPPVTNPYAAPQGGKGMGYGYQPSYNPYATQSPYVNYNQPSYGSIGGKGGSIGGKGMTAGGKGG